MIIKLNKEIYPVKAVRKAVHFYRKIAAFKLKEEGGYLLVSGKPEKEDEELVRDEFLNFVLGIIRQ
ncbi:MAG: HxsD-like protein [bacterium]|nr:HxsD-like protein [bacterium]